MNNQIKIKKISSVFVLTFAFALSLFTPVNAQSNVIGGSPAYPQEDNPRTESIFIHKIEKGGSVSDGVRVINNTNAKKTLRVFPVDIAKSNDGAFACSKDADVKTNIGKWVSFDQTSVTLEANSNKIIPMKIAVPKNTSPGEYNGCVIIKEENPTPLNTGTGLLITFERAIRTTVIVPGEIIKNIVIKDFKYTLANKKTQLQAKIGNSGNVSQDIKAIVTIKDLLGNQINKVEGIYTVQSNTDLSLNFELPVSDWGGSYTANLQIEYDSNPNTVLGESTEADFNKSLDKKIGLFIIPQAMNIAGIIGILTLICILIAVIIYSLRNKFINTSKWVEYTVKDQDTLVLIASMYDIPWKKLAAANKITEPYTLRVGQNILVPPTSGSKSTV